MLDLTTIVKLATSLQLYPNLLSSTLALPIPLLNRSMWLGVSSRWNLFHHRYLNIAGRVKVIAPSLD